MGWLGLGIGFVTRVVGEITDDEDLKVKGNVRMAKGAVTMLAGDIFGISDGMQDSTAKE